MVVQCPTCQSKFRIADEKVTDRGVRVRCTSCKNVFQVRKPGSAGAEPAGGPGSTIDLASLGAAAVAKTAAGSAARPAGAARPGTGPVKPSTGPVKPSTGPVKPSTGPVRTTSVRPPTGPVKPSTGPVKPSTGPVKPSTGPVKPSTGPLRTTAARSVAVQGGDGAARRLDVDDLFGMAELTGDAPLSGPLDPPAAPAPKAAEPPPASPLDDLDLEIDRARQKPADAAPAAAPADAPPPLDAPLPAPAPEAPAAGLDSSLGHPPAALPSGASNLELVEPKPAAEAKPLEAPPAPAPSKPRTDPIRRPTTKPQPQAKQKEPEIAPAKAVVSSALTGLLGAALAIIVVIASALSDENASGWFGFGPPSEVIATGVVSGLYDTAGGKPVFYIRGRIQNRSDKVRGPVRVTAELLADGSPEARAEAIAGSEPTPEDVWSVRSSADVEKLSRTLQAARVERKLQPGDSLPFFAVIPDPPADLDRHRLQIKVETVEAWTPGAAKTAREK
ncbi:MAG TPA: zinc-ribbon domain-containing protein [Myxococcales bacterium]|nr:zinc-ribbon domain-containing protein [Myxococcales bacterium]